MKRSQRNRLQNKQIESPREELGLIHLVPS
jgi:hypothetical protein